MKMLYVLLLAVIMTLISKNNALAAVPNPEFSSVGVTQEDIGLTDDMLYTFSDGKIQISPEQSILMINGAFTAKAKGINKPNSFYLPLRPIAEAFGLDVRWNAKDRRIILSNDGQKIELTLNDNVVIVNGKLVKLNVAGIATPIISPDGITYAPWFFFKEYLSIEITDNSSIASGVTALDKTGTADKTKTAAKDMLPYVKESLMKGLVTCKADKRYIEVISKIEEDIKNTALDGTLGRYAVFKGPYTILVDTETNDIYFYLSAHALGAIIRADFNDPELFLNGYILG